MKNIKRIIALVLCLVLTVAVVPMTANAALSEYSEGELLLRMSTFDAGSVTINTAGATVKNTPNVSAKRGTGSQILANSTETYGGVGVSTNLPLNGDTKYTIEYYAKITDPSLGMGVFLGFCHNANYPYYGASFYTYASGTKVTTQSKWWIDGWYKQGSTTDRYGRTINNNVWTTKADSDGFVKFVMTFDGQYMGLSIGGTDIGVKYDMDRPGTTNFKSVDNWEVKNLYLQAGFTGLGLDSNNSATKPSSGDCIVEIKNISVYSGIVNPAEVEDPKFVTMKDSSGNIIKSVQIKNNALTLAQTDFPSMGKTVAWVNAATGALVEIGDTITDSITLVPVDAGSKTTRMLDVQYGIAENGRQNIFLHGLELVRDLLHLVQKVLRSLRSELPLFVQRHHSGPKLPLT